MKIRETALWLLVARKDAFRYAPTMSHSPERVAWFREAGFGLFIHWGPYAVGERGEWIMNRERIPFAEYAAEYAARFRAERYDPAAWAALAREAGMEYVVLTTRHHDGFCLWETQTTDFHAGRLGSGRDLLRDYVTAVRAAGLKVGFYYSVADWRHPDYPDAFSRDWPQRWHDEAARQRFVAFVRSQLEELMTRYGTIDLLWYDGAIPTPLDGAETNRLVYGWQPGILINERLGDPCDFHCSEQSVKARQGPWEACITITESSWGYHAHNQRRKSASEIIGLLAKAAAGGGNLLLNVGPRPDGTIPEEDAVILRQVGDWLRRNPGWWRSADRSPFSWFTCGETTVKGNRVYLHLLRWNGSRFCWAELANRVLAVRLLDGGRPLPFEQHEGRLIIRDLPVPPDPVCCTIEIETDGPPQALVPQTTFWIPG